MSIIVDRVRVLSKLLVVISRLGVNTTTIYHIISHQPNHRLARKDAKYLPYDAWSHII